MSTDLWIATTNKGKVNEIRPLLEKAGADLQIHTLEELPHYSQPPENGKTFLDNARLKARSVKTLRPGAWVLAEDSGLEVEALGGLPGIHSARYAGAHASDSENVAKLLKMLQIKGAPTRNAKFLCTMVIFDPQGVEHIFTGELLGTIGKAPQGQMGFGYDPVFIPTGETKSMAELGPAFKNRHSHRAQATHTFIQKLLHPAT